MAARYPGVAKFRDGLWRGRCVVVRQGEKARLCVYAPTARECWEKMQTAKADAERGILPDNPTLAEFLNRWIEAKEAAREFTTTRGYRNIVRAHLVPTLGHVHLRKLGLLDVNAMLGERAKTRGARTVHNIRSVLRNALNDAKAQGLVERNVADERVNLPRLPAARANFLEAHEAQAVLKAAEGDRLEAVFAILALGLQPPAEVLGLRWRDIDLESARPSLSVRNALHRRYHAKAGERLVLKGLKAESRYRTLQLPAFVVRALQGHKARQAAEQLRAGADWLAGADGDFVFTSELGTPLGDKPLRAYVYEVLRRAGIDRAARRITLYGFRHTAASLVYAQTGDFKLVAAILGHSNVAMAQKTYVHLMGGSDGRAADALERALGQ